MREDISGESVYLLCYTRTPLEEQVYSPKLAFSMHLAYSEDGKHYEALNDNSGVLFARATSNPDGTLHAKSMKNPYVFRMADGRFGILAVSTEHAGERDPERRGSVLLFTTEDFLSYEEIGPVLLNRGVYVEDAICEYDDEARRYIIHWRDIVGSYWRNAILDLTQRDAVSAAVSAAPFSFARIETAIEGAVPRNAIRVPREIGGKVRTKLSELRNTEIRVPAAVQADSAAELASVRATAIYNDGSTALMRVVWESDHIDWDVPGTYEATGVVQQVTYPFPFAVNRADPCIIRYNGMYYFIATNDDYSRHQGLYVREAATIPELAGAEEKLIIGNGSYPFLHGVFWWAPEFHLIGDDMYVFFAGSSGEFGDIHAHVMRLRNGGSPALADDWEMPIRVRQRDGNPLFEAGITLDMTYFEAGGIGYVAWAQRQLTPVDLGSWLYIAQVDPEEPWRLTNVPVVISKPDYGWANNRTFVDEGPFAIVTEERVLLTFSSALVDATYCVGMLSARSDADLMDPANWHKGNYPLLTSRSVPGQYGPGHNAYVHDDDGNLLNVYHGRPGIDEPRCTGIRRVHYDIDGDPVLDMTEDRDLNDSLRKVATTVIVSR
jgi:GH43 family beta-xylosidase